MRVPLLDYARTSATSAFPSRDVTEELLSGVFTARCKLHLLCTARSDAPRAPGALGYCSWMSRLHAVVRRFLHLL